jgi:hypothetical protein
MSNPITRQIFENAGYDAEGRFWMGLDEYNDGEIRFSCSSNRSDVSDDICVLCGKGWEKTVLAFCDQMWDEDALAHLHRTCFERTLGHRERRDFLDALKEAGFDRQMLMQIKQIPNEYRGAWNVPWYELPVPFLPNAPVLKFGARKRVYNIEIKGINDLGVSLLADRFKEESTTKEGYEGLYLIHAHGMAKASEYLKGILEVLRQLEISLKEVVDANANK